MHSFDDADNYENPILMWRINFSITFIIVFLCISQETNKKAIDI